MGGQQRGGELRDRDRTYASCRLGFLAQERPILELNQLLGHSDLSILQVDLAAAKTHQLAPTHTRIDGDVDQRPISLAVRFGESDHLVPVEESFPASGHEVDRLARTGSSGSSASGQRPAACGEGFGSGDEPTTGRCRRRSRRSTSFRSRRPATGQVGMDRIAAARTCRSRADRSPAWSARVAGTAIGTLWPRPRAACQRCGDRPRSLPRRERARSRGFPGFLVVNDGQCRSQRKQPLTWQCTTSEVERRRWESNPCTGLCRLATESALYLVRGHELTSETAVEG